jgi:hypothetical protein
MEMSFDTIFHLPPRRIIVGVEFAGRHLMRLKYLD